VLDETSSGKGFIDCKKWGTTISGPELLYIGKTNIAPFELIERMIPSAHLGF